MTTRVQALTIITLGATLTLAPAQPPPAAQTAPPLSPTEQTIKDIKNPAKWINWGADFRARNEYFNNLLTLDDQASLHEQDYFRFRARLWTSIMPLEGLSLNARLAAEPREWMRPAGYTTYRGDTGLDWREGIIDNLNVEYKNIADLPLMIRVGRQSVNPETGTDLLAGRGWLLADGTPADGSWTYYLDAARLKYELTEQHTIFEAMGIIQDAHDDAWLPTLNNQNYLQSEQSENGAIFQVANSSFKAANLTGYFIYKHDSKEAAKGDDADIYTVGARVNGSLDDHWQYWLEGAYQFGWKSDANILYPSPSTSSRDLLAYGFNSHLSYLFKDKLDNQLNLTVELLSGDDPSTEDDEMFDVLWGRWPRWNEPGVNSYAGEIGLYNSASETRIGQQANVLRLGPTWTLNPTKPMKFSASYYALFALESTPTRAANDTLFSYDGHFRGHYASAVLKYKFGPHMSGHLWSEFFFPGDYYSNHEMMTFLRAEVIFTF